MRTAAAVLLSLLALGSSGCFGDDGGTTGKDTSTTGTAPADHPADPQDKGPGSGAGITPDDHSTETVP